MALVLDATVGGASANSYLTRAAAQALIDALPNADAWTGASDAGKDLALVRATALLEMLAFQGTKRQSTPGLAWPRYGVVDPDYGDDCVLLDSDTIPRRAQMACVELAIVLLRAGTSDVWGEDESVNVKSETLGPISTEYADHKDRRRGLRKYPQVWRQIFPLTTSAESATVVRA